jgi:hypothetical protein
MHLSRCAGRVGSDLILFELLNRFAEKNNTNDIIMIYLPSDSTSFPSVISEAIDSWKAKFLNMQNVWY